MDRAHDLVGLQVLVRVPRELPADVGLGPVDLRRLGVDVGGPGLGVGGLGVDVGGVGGGPGDGVREVLGLDLLREHGQHARGDRRGDGAEDRSHADGRREVALLLGLADHAHGAEALGLALGALDDEVGHVDRDREEDDEREGDAGAQVAVLPREDAVAHDRVERRGADARRDGRQDPADHDLRDAARPGEVLEGHVVGVLVPDHAARRARHERHADDASYTRMGGGDR